MEPPIPFIANADADIAAIISAIPPPPQEPPCNPSTSSPNSFKPSICNLFHCHLSSWPARSTRYLMFPPQPSFFLSSSSPSSIVPIIPLSVCSILQSFFSGARRPSRTFVLDFPAGHPLELASRSDNKFLNFQGN